MNGMVPVGSRGSLAGADTPSASGNASSSSGTGPQAERYDRELISAVVFFIGRYVVGSELRSVHTGCGCADMAGVRFLDRLITAYNTSSERLECVYAIFSAMAAHIANPCQDTYTFATLLAYFLLDRPANDGIKEVAGTVLMNRRAAFPLPWGIRVLYDHVEVQRSQKK